jgi:hypothetical protein
MIEPTCELFYKWKIGGKPEGILRMDNTKAEQCGVENVSKS